jgi:hypothetical protein
MIRRWLRLRMPEWLELAWLGAPSRPGPTGRLALSLYRAWNPQALFVIVDTYIDESGTHGDSPHLIMGGMVGRLGQWADFDKLWRKMLRQENLEFYRTKTMKDGHDGFKGWDGARKARLVDKIGKIKKKTTMFGFSIKLRKEDYDAHYRKGVKLKKYQWDTMYGICFRYCTLFIGDKVKKTFPDKNLTVNFIVEQGAKNFGQAKRIFDELKKEDPFKDVFGVIIPGTKTQFPGLQGADFVSHTTFLAEQDENIDLTDFPAGANINDARRIMGRKSPDFRCELGPELLADWHQRMLGLEERRLAFGRQRKFNSASSATEAAE